MKRIWVMSMLMLAFVLIVSGCNGAPEGKGSGNGSEDEIKGKIVFVSGRIDLTAEIQKIAEQFSQKYPGTTVEVQTIKDNSPLKIQLSSGDGPDVMYNPNVLNEQMEQFFLPLDDLGFNADNLLYYGTASHNGKVYGLNEGAYLTGILYNKRVFADVGITAVPKTLDELHAALDKLKAAGILPMGSMVKQVWPLNVWTTVAAALTGDPEVNNKTAELDDPFSPGTPYGQQIEFVLDLIKRGYMEEDRASSDWDILRKEMGAGKVGMLMLANYGIGAIEGLDSSDVGFFPLPIDNSGTPVTMLTNGVNLMINKNTKNPAVAKAFVKYWLMESNYEDLIGVLPSYKSKPSGNKQLAEFMEMNPKQYPVNPDSDKLAQLVNKLEFNIGNVLAEAMLSMDPQQVADKYNKQWSNARAAMAK